MKCPRCAKQMRQIENHNAIFGCYLQWFHPIGRLESQCTIYMNIRELSCSGHCEKAKRS